MGDQGVGGTVPVGFSIVSGVVTGLCGLVFIPFFRDRNTSEHGMVNLGGCGPFEQLCDACTLLKKVYVVQMNVAVAEVMGSRTGCREGKE